MGWFSSAWSAVKSAAKAVVKTVLEWGGKVVDKVKETWTATKRAVRRAAEWVVEKVEAVAAAVSRVAKTLIQKFKEWLGIDEASLLRDLITKLTETVNAIIAAAEAVTRGEELTSFEEYLQATAALRIARTWLKNLEAQGAGGLDEPGLRAMRALHDLFVEGKAEVDAVRALDAYCREFMKCAGGFVVLGAESLQATWVTELEAKEAEHRRVEIEISKVELEARKLDRRKDVQGAANQRALRERLERVQSEELAPRARDLALASQVMEGIICDLNGEEPDIYLRRDAKEAGEILGRWHLGGEVLTEDETRKLREFAGCYEARATARADRVREDLGQGAEAPTPTPVG